MASYGLPLDQLEEEQRNWELVGGDIPFEQYLINQGLISKTVSKKGESDKTVFYQEQNRELEEKTNTPHVKKNPENVKESPNKKKVTRDQKLTSHVPKVQQPTRTATTAQKEKQKTTNLAYDNKKDKEENDDQFMMNLVDPKEFSRNRKSTAQQEKGALNSKLRTSKLSKNAGPVRSRTSTSKTDTFHDDFTKDAMEVVKEHTDNHDKKDYKLFVITVPSNKNLRDKYSLLKQKNDKKNFVTPYIMKHDKINFHPLNNSEKKFNYNNDGSHGYFTSHDNKHTIKLLDNPVTQVREKNIVVLNASSEISEGNKRG